MPDMQGVQKRFTSYKFSRDMLTWMDNKAKLIACWHVEANNCDRWMNFSPQTMWIITSWRHCYLYCYSMWLCSCFGSNLDLVILAKLVNAGEYCSPLNIHLFLVQDDNEQPQHTAKTGQLKRDTSIARLVWLAPSLYLNSVEHIWGHFDRNVREPN